MGAGMDQQIVRDCDKAERLERGLADYHHRLQSGMTCRDPLSPHERTRTNSRFDQRLRSARDFVRTHIRH
jgi:hypothetical protein